MFLCNPMDSDLPGSSVHEISQERTLDWVAISSSRGYSKPRDQTRVSRIAEADSLPSEPTGKLILLNVGMVYKVMWGKKALSRTKEEVRLNG